MSGFVLEFANVTRWYGQVVALRDVSINFSGGVVGLLGPNGAGKTTFLRLVTGCMPPSKGIAHVFGAPAFGPRTFPSPGYRPDHDNFYEFMTGQEFVRTSACTDRRGRDMAARPRRSTGCRRARDRKSTRTERHAAGCWRRRSPTIPSCSSSTSP